MYSLNVPVPGEVKRLAGELFPRLLAFERVREDHTLLVKRFESAANSGSSLELVRKRVRPALVGASAFEARVTEVDRFEGPVRGPGPVLYLAVESRGLHRIHRRLVEEFGAVPDLEGSEYTPHVTLARGGSPETARGLVGKVEPVEWTVSELHLWDPRRREALGRIPLPV